MATVEGSDVGTGLAFVFGLIALLAALVTTVASFADATGGGGDLQVLSGLAMAVAMLAAGLAVAALHVWGWG